MKKVVFLLLFIIFGFICHAQWSLDYKRDYCWIMGIVDPPFYQTSILDFNNSPLVSSAYNSPIDFFLTNASICDENGNLLFYTNGMKIADRAHQIMPHGDSINPGIVYNIWSFDHPTGYPLNQGVIVLPKPGHPEEFVIIHETIERDLNYPGGAPIYGLKYTLVNMTLHDELGDIDTTQKNVEIIHDTLENGAITAVRHGNGRDWWILVPELSHGRYYHVLLTPDGFSNIGLQTIGMVSLEQSFSAAVFSPDGSKYARFGGLHMNSINHLELFDFDRCTGLLSNPVNLSFLVPNTLGSLAFSANSRFLYYSTGSNIFQFDLQANDISASKQIVAYYDGFISQNPVSLDFMQLAPDGKIYVEGGDSDYYSKIESPDSAGMACNVMQHSLHLNSWIRLTIPNFPNYRLFNLPGSVCDSLIYLGNPEIKQDTSSSLLIFPNPVLDNLNIKYDLGNKSPVFIHIIDLYSDVVYEKSISNSKGNINVNVSDWKPGMYFAMIIDKSGNKVSSKFCLLR